MANRHHLRSIVLQTLFEWDFRSLESSSAAIDSLKGNLEEFAPENLTDTFPVMLVEGVLKKQKVIDEIIEKAAPDWPIPRIAMVDRNILRLGLFELLFADRNQVPPKVAINEAIELAKAFGGENSGRFVNGVLGAVYKEIGEPGKDQASKQDPPQETPYEEMPVDRKAGAVVYSFDESGEIQLAMVHDIFGYWTLSKSGVKEGETPESSATRAIKEEIGLEVAVESELGQNEYIANHPQRGKVRKFVHYYLAKSDFKPVMLYADSGGLDDAKWFPITDVVNLDMYEDITEMIGKAVEIIAQGSKTPDDKDSQTSEPEPIAEPMVVPPPAPAAFPAEEDSALEAPVRHSGLDIDIVKAEEPEPASPKTETQEKPKESKKKTQKKSETSTEEDDEDLSFLSSFLEED